MGARGPVKEPAWLQVVKGNSGRRQISDIPETPVTKPVTTLAAPESFDEECRLIWNKVTEVLALAGALTRADKFTLARYCEFAQQYQIAHRSLRHLQGQQGNVQQVVYGSKDGNGQVKMMRAVPHLELMMRLSQTMLRFEREFGLTPSSRAMWGQPLGGAGDEGNEVDEFLD